MELRVLEYFLALTREGSVSAAAEALHVSQPTLSRQLIDLERELGTTLFERGRRGITLTEDGLLLRRRASEIVDLVGITQRELAQNRGTVAGEIRFGCAETRAMDLVAGVMRGLQSAHPQVTFRVSSGLAEDVVEQINHGLLDFGLLLRVRERWGLGSLKLPTNERPMALMRTDSPLAKRASLALADLYGQRLIIPSSWRESRILADEAPRSEGGRLDVAAEYDLPYNATRMVLADMGVALMLEGLVEERLAEGLTWCPLDVELDMPSYLVWKPFQLRSRACEAFLQRAQEEFVAPGATG